MNQVLEISYVLIGYIGCRSQFTMLVRRGISRSVWRAAQWAGDQKAAGLRLAETRGVKEAPDEGGGAHNAPEEVSGDPDAALPPHGWLGRQCDWVLGHFGEGVGSWFFDLSRADS